MSKRILHVVTNVSQYEGIHQPTGLWLGELTHAYDEFEKQNYIQDIVSPLGGKSPIEPKSLGLFVADQSVLKEKMIKHLCNYSKILKNHLKSIGKTMM